MRSVWKYAWPLAPVITLGVVLPVVIADSWTKALSHIPLALLLWASGWLYCDFGNVRRSAGAFTAGAAQFYLALVVSVFPQILKSSIAAGSLGLGITLLLSMAMFPVTAAVYRWRTIVALVIAGSSVALLPLLTSLKVPDLQQIFAGG